MPTANSVTTHLKRLATASLLMFGLSATALAADRLPGGHRWYAGIETGYGDTNWRFLLPYCQGSTSCTTTVSKSAPVKATDGGLFTGLYLGYNITHHAAFEMNIVRMSNTHLNFADANFYKWLENKDDLASVISHTYTFNWVVKLRTPIMSTHWYGFLNAGAAITHRVDKISKLTHTNPTFGMGLGREFNNRYQLELFGQYTAGFDHASLTPADDYVPFLMQMGLKMGVLFDL